MRERAVKNSTDLLSLAQLHQKKLGLFSIGVGDFWSVDASQSNARSANVDCIAVNDPAPAN